MISIKSGETETQSKLLIGKFSEIGKRFFLNLTVVEILTTFKISWFEFSDKLQTIDPLPALNGNSPTISGFSSGAVMAAQYHVIHSSSLDGAGIVAGGPYLDLFHLFLQ